MADQNNKNVDALAQEITLDGGTHHWCYLRMATYSGFK